MHNSRDGVSEALVKECGALAGTLMVCPARATMVSPRNVTRTSGKDSEHLLEVVPVRRRPAAWRDVHVDEGVLAGGVLAGHEDCVGVADEPDVRQALIFVRPRAGEPA